MTTKKTQTIKARELDAIQIDQLATVVGGFAPKVIGREMPSPFGNQQYYGGGPYPAFN